MPAPAADDWNPYADENGQVNAEYVGPAPAGLHWCVQCRAHTVDPWINTFVAALDTVVRPGIARTANTQVRACLTSLFGQQVSDWSDPQSVFELAPMVPTTDPAQTNVLVKYYEPATHSWVIGAVAPDTYPPWYERKIRYRQLGSAGWTVLASYMDARFNEPIAAPGWEAQGAYYDSRAPAHYASPWSRSHIILPD